MSTSLPLCQLGSAETVPLRVGFVKERRKFGGDSKTLSSSFRKHKGFVSAFVSLRSAYEMVMLLKVNLTKWLDPLLSQDNFSSG